MIKLPGLWPHLLALGGVLCFARSCLAFDFTLSTLKVEEDGFTHDQSYFSRDPRTNIGIRVPPLWLATGTPAALTLTLPAVTGSTLRLEPSAQTPATAFDDKGLDTYRKAVLAEIPPGAINIRLSGEKTNPLPIFHWTDHEFTMEYSLYGQLYTRSVLFVNLDARQQIRLSSIAPKTAFDQVHEAGFSLLQSWQDMPVTAATAKPK